jgi:hypothetical protein
VATKAEIDQAATVYVDTIRDMGFASVTADKLRVTLMPNGAWGLVLLDDDDRNVYSVVRVLGDTKGQALDALQAMTFGAAYGMRWRED